MSLGMSHQPAKAKAKAVATSRKETSTDVVVARTEVTVLRKPEALVPDPYSVAHADAVSKHFELLLEPDFMRKELHGKVTHTVIRRVPSARAVHFDAAGSMILHRITDAESGEELKFRVAPANFGVDICVELPEMEDDEHEPECQIQMEYTARSDAEALQWIDARDTLGGNYPMVYSLCRPIHARTMVPCQDTPSFLSTFELKVFAPKHMTVLASGEHQSIDDADEKGKAKVYSFKQEHALPIHKFSFAIGRFESRELGPRTKLWGEPEQIERAAQEFEDADKWLNEAEELMGDFPYERFDICIMPPFFPFGAVENGGIAFVSPTLLGAEHALIATTIKQIFHAWIGGAISYKSWEHFTMFEGMTTFLSRKLIGRMYGEDARHLEYLSGYKAFSESLGEKGRSNPTTTMCPNLAGGDLDVALDPAAAEKGAIFMFHLESKLGGAEAMDAFLKCFVKQHSGKSLVTREIVDAMHHHFGEDKHALLRQIEWERWMFVPGMPPVVNDYDIRVLIGPERLALKWIAGYVAPPDHLEDMKDWSSSEICAFLDRLLATGVLSASLLSAMDKAYHFSDSKNCEIKFRWLRCCLRSGWAAAYPDALMFLMSQGRIKYNRPLFRDLAKNPDGSRLSRSTFLRHHKKYHRATSAFLREDLGITEAEYQDI